MSIKRMRVFAGPNGSGKTTIIKSLQEVIPFGVYINADDIELQLAASKILLFSSFQLNISQDQLQDFFQKSTFSLIKRNESDLWTKITVERNIFKINTPVDSYLAADIATDDPEINISRVNVRVTQNGHDVAPETITDRYYKSLNQVRDAIRNSDNAYFWDNSSSASLLIADIKEGPKVTIVHVEKVPNWCIEYVVNTT